MGFISPGTAAIFQGRVLLLHIQVLNALSRKEHKAAETDSERRRDAIGCKEGLETQRPSSFQYRSVCS